MSRRFGFGLCLLPVLSGFLVVVSAPLASAQTLFTTAHELPMSNYSDNVVDLAAGRIYLSPGHGDHRIVVTDLSGEVLDELDGHTGASALALSADGASLYVALETSRIERVDTATSDVTRDYELPTDWVVTDMAVAGGAVWFTAMSGCCQGSLYRLDPATGERTHVPLSAELSDAAAVVATPDGSRPLVLDTWESRVTALDASTGLPVAGRELAVRPTTLDRSPTGQVFLGTATSSVSRLEFLDPATLATERSVSLPWSPFLSTATTNGDLVTTAASPLSTPAAYVVDAATSETRNTFLVPTPWTDQEYVVETILTPGGLLALTQEGSTIRLHRAPDPGIESTAFDLSLASDSMTTQESVLSGILTDRGEPVAGATVDVSSSATFRPSQPWTQQVVTGPDGTFSLPYTPRFTTETVTVEFAGDETHPGAWYSEYVHSAARPVLLDVTGPGGVDPGADIVYEGTLTSLGEPVPGAVVDVQLSCSVNGDLSVTTDSLGHFTARYQPGRCLTSTARFYYGGSDTTESATLQHTVAINYVLSSMTLDQSETTAPVDSTLRWSGTVRVDGQPAADVPVDVAFHRVGEATPFDARVVHTAPDGSFGLDRTFPVAGDYRITATYSGNSTTYPTSRRATFSIDPIPTALQVDQPDLNVLAGDTVTISGRLLTDDGTPVADTPVEVVRDGTALSTGVVTAADGGFSFQDRPPGPGLSSVYVSNDVTYTLRTEEGPRYAAARAFVTARVELVPTTLVVRTSPDSVKPGETVTIEGQLLAANGESMSGRTVSIRWRSSVTDHSTNVTTSADGRFSLDVVPTTGLDHEVQVRFARTERYRDSLAVSGWLGEPLPGSLHLDPVADLLPGEPVTITGRVTDTDGNGESTRAHISSVDESGEVVDYFSVQTDDEGRFEFITPATRVGRLTFTVRTQTRRIAQQVESVVVDVRSPDIRTRATRPRLVRNGWAVYDADSTPRVVSRTLPARAGECVRHQLQRRVSGTWRSVSTSPCATTGEAGRVRYRVTARHTTGTRFRVRALWERRSTVTGAWVRLRFR